MSTPLEELGYPLFFRVDDAGDADLDAPTPRLDQAHRTRVRALSGMQKEALVTSSVSGDTWRIVSDEGEYLDGADVAPSPLACMTTGMVSSYATEILALADERGIDVDDLTLVQDNYYTMKGSALRGTMTGGALPVDLEARIDADADESALRDLVETATATSPVHGLMVEALSNRFKLALNGEAVDTDRVEELDGDLLREAVDPFGAISRDAPEQDPPNVYRTGKTTESLPEADRKYTAGEGSSLEEEQDRILHLRGICSLDEEGVKEITVKIFSPQGTIFELRSDEPEGHGGRGRAPDAASYMAAGIGFCFMTQFGRYAEITKQELSDYRIVQDTHLSGGVAGAHAGTADAGESADVEPARADPVETHVYLDSPEGPEFARDALDMSEQTCFLHAFCRTALDGPNVEVTTG